MFYYMLSVLLYASMLIVCAYAVAKIIDLFLD